MSVSILLTKFFIPPARPKLVSRPRLIERFNHNLHRKLTLVSAPAGFGKTTLVIDWLQSRKEVTSSPIRVGWLSLDDGDNDVVRFLTYLVTALNRIKNLETKIGISALQLLQSPQPVPPETILINIINEIAFMADKIVLILDDLHLIDSRQVHESLNFLIENQPPQLHLVITTREDPPIQISRLRARGQLHEVRGIDLRFSVEETAVFLHQITGLKLPDDDIATITTRTEGWITGLQMAAISLQSSEDAAGFIQSFAGSHRFVLDYLLEEVLEQHSEEIQTFLLQTSILQRLTGSLCDAVTGQTNSREILEFLDRSNQFIVLLDDERQWYRYHHLFSDLLKQQLQNRRPGLVAKLHQKAGNWYANNDFPINATHHAIAAADFELAADRIEANGLALIGQGAYTTLQKWINRLPKSIVRKRPYLCVYQAWASHFSHELTAVEPYLNNANRALDALNLPTSDDVYKDIQGHIATLQAQDARRQHNNRRAITLLTKAVDSLGSGSAFVRTLAELSLGLAYMDQGELVKAATSFRNAITNGRASGNDLANMIAISHLVAVLILQGRLHDAEKLCRQTIEDQANNHEKLPPTTCMIFLRLGYILAEWNDVAGYFENLSQCILLANQIGYFGVVKSASQSMKWYQQILAKQGKIVEFPAEVSTLIDRTLSPQISISNTILEIQTVENYLVDDAYFEIFPGYTEISRSKKLAQENKVRDALSLLAKVYASAQIVEGIGLMIEARVTEASIYQSQGENDHALAALADALSLSEPEGYIRTYADRGEPMKQLLVEAAKQGGSLEYILKLLSAPTRCILKNKDKQKPKNVDYFRVPRPLWRILKRCLPKPPPKRGPGRPRADNRAVVNGIWYVLWTGCQWKAVHRTWFGVSSSVLHQRFQLWQQQGIWDKVLQRMVRFYHRQRRIGWKWQAIDSKSVPAPLGGEATGRNPTDRSKRGAKIHILVDERGFETDGQQASMFLPHTLIEPLSDRELEVLKLIAEGLTRQEIAAKLFLSKNTVKTHARNIYGKLGVNNQMQAVGKARELGLLEKN
jgi:LuxR family maltose regulon positive regulatory protein